MCSTGVFDRGVLNRTSHLVSPFAVRAWRAAAVLCNTGSVRATFFEFFYGIRTPAPVVA